VNDEPFSHKRFAIRVMQSKGHFLKKLPDGTYVDTDAEVMTVFNLQLPSWEALFKKHNFAADESFAERMLTAFGHREVKGGPGKVLETFAAHLDAQPRQGGSPDWSKAGREWRECGYCDGRGVVSDIPVRVERRGETVDRTYSFACVCDNGRRFAGVKVAEDWMIRFAADRKTAEIARHEARLASFGIDPRANEQARASQFRAAILRMRQQVGSGAATARTATPSPPQTVVEARAMLAARKPRKPSPPPQLNPEAVALAVFANGDERNEWE
jgi:hypothetical protein